jgi:DNA repair protein RecO (recombination protein O)
VSERYTTSHGIVIRRFEHTNGDVQVTLLNEGGKWRGIARKGKKIGGHLGRLSLFHDVTVQYYKKADEEIVLLTQIQLNGALPKLSDPGIYPYAHILAELVDALTVDVHIGEQLYEYFASGLRGLNQHQDPEAVTIVYAWKLLQQAGLAPRLMKCATCGKSDPGSKNLSFKFDVATGGMTCQTCNTGMTISEAVLEDLKTIHTQTTRQALSQPLHDKQLHWTLLNRYTTYHVRELHSLQTLAQLVLTHA